MSFFPRIDKSKSGSIIHKITTQQALPVGNLHPRQNARYPSRPSFGNRLDINEQIRSNFIRALVNAGRCRWHRKEIPAILHLTKPRKRCLGTHGFHSQLFQPLINRCNHTSALQTGSSLPASKQEYLELVDQYDLGRWSHYYSSDSDLYEKSPGPHLIVSDKPEDSEWPPPQQIWNLDSKYRGRLRDLEQALVNLYHDPEDTYQLYKALPAPRVPYLTAKTRHRLLRNLGVVPRKDEHSMLRYLSVVDDMKVTAIPLSVPEWNLAMSFTGRYVSTTTEVEVEAGLQLFREMEHVAGVQANSATFNILFDVATKAGKFILAEMIYKEMKRRGHSFNRFHHVSMIHHYGLMGDGDGVRHAYKTLVESGEIVDTVVLNCVMSSLIRARESQAAELVYERMKILHSQKENAPLPPKEHRDRRMVSQLLVQMAHVGRQFPDKLEGYQERSIVAPDFQTYRILIQHTAVHSGDLHKTTTLLDEMQWYQISLHGSIFLALFKGFARHGGIRYTQWTTERLESVWRAYVHVIDTGESDSIYVGRWIVVWAIKAFAKCSGKKRVSEIWEEIRPKWRPQDHELDAVVDILQVVSDSAALSDSAIFETADSLKEDVERDTHGS